MSLDNVNEHGENPFSGLNKLDEKYSGPESKLQAGIKTFKQRNGLYKDMYKQAGEVLLALFPDRKLPSITDPKQAARLRLIIMAAGKLQRYCTMFEQGGHVDSAHDLMIFAAMLEEIT